MPPAYMLVPTLRQKVVRALAGRTWVAGATDHDLVLRVPQVRGELGRWDVEGTGYVLGAVTSIAEDHCELEVITPVQLLAAYQVPF